MDKFVFALYVLLIVLSPILVAYISYRSNKKTKREIRQELEKSLHEKEAETTQILTKINAELESQKQMAVWNNSLPQAERYADLVGAERYGNISGIVDLVYKLQPILADENISVDELRDIKTMLGKINLPLEEDTLYPYEVHYLIAYKKLIRQIDELIQKKMTVLNE